MPFKSQAQVGYMFANHPKIAKEFASKTPNISALPDKVKSPRPAAPKNPMNKVKAQVDPGLSALAVPSRPRTPRVPRKLM